MKKHEIKQGEVYGYLTVICEDQVKYKSGKKDRAAKCKCVCGETVIVILTNLKRGTTKSCGCKADYGKHLRTHGLSKHPLFSVWTGLISRTTDDPTYVNYKYYYGKGVRICDEWKNNFKAFYDWAIDKWKPGLQLDKDIIPSKLNIPALLYSPEMCCFVTPSENNNNKIDSDFVEYKGVKMTSTQLARSVGIKPHTFHTRLHRQKWTIEQAVLPVKK